MSELPFLDLLRRSEDVGFQTEDLLVSILPLFRQVAGWHEAGLVAPWRGLENLKVGENAELRFEGSGISPRGNLAAVETLQTPVASALHVVGHTRVTSDDKTGIEVASLDVADGTSPLAHPVYITGYRTWEELTGHHDATTDILALGQLLASLALTLDFTEQAELARFASRRSNLFSINARLHPVIAAVIVEMTELNRHRRSPDLPSLIQRLETYREQSSDLDISRLPGFGDATLSGRRRLVQTHLRDRLFEISRRNRLLYFRPSQASVNFTVASVPMVMNLRSVRLEQLFLWHPALAAEIVEGKPLNLGRWLRFEDQPYLPSALDKLISEARRDRAEYGFAQLRLVVAFFHWHNLKEAPQERITSPLLLLPVELSKKKGVRDQYLLDPTSAEAEVNPALRHHLQQIYGLRLPETVDLAETSLEQFHQDLQAQIRATEPGVTLRYLDRPEIELIHERARQRLAQFQRRQKLRNPVQPKKTFSYSYDAENFQPLGLQMFREKVEPSPLPQRAAAGGLPKPRVAHMVAEAAGEPVHETERQTFALREERASNPYVWDFDLCALTVGNFNYRKMSLVRDYGALVENDLTSQAFDSVFSLDPRKIDEDVVPEIPQADQWPVVSGDATQAAAIALARTGRSYIIQGPPGTGKSQTITNLIADQVAKNRRVLFVCEKRAAIDVVYHRLRQQGLDELCTLIHDSQTDKKAFVLNLKQTYESWLAEPDGADAARQQRDALLQQMAQDIGALQKFDDAMRSVPDSLAVPVRELIHRLVELREFASPLSPGQAEGLPDFATWRRHAPVAAGLSLALKENCGCFSLAQHSFRMLGRAVIQADRPLESLQNLTAEAEAALDDICARLESTGLEPGTWDTFAKLQGLLADARQLTGLATRGQLELLGAETPAFQKLKDAAESLRKANAAVEKAQGVTKSWKDKLPSGDVQAALAVARASENSLLRFIKPSWWKFCKVIDARYDFSQHAVAPSYTQILSDLEAEYAAVAARDEMAQAASLEYGSEPVVLIETLRPWHATDSAMAARRGIFLETPNAREVVEQLNGLTPLVARLDGVLEKLLDSHREHSLEGLGIIARDLREDAEALPDLLPMLTELAETPADFSRALRHLSLQPEQLEAAVAHEELEKIYRRERWLPRFDGRLITHRATRFGKAKGDWLDKNAALLRAEVRRRFRANVQTASLSATQLDAAGKAFKKSYSAGRRELEHEFGKSMRYKSIRELAAGDSGRVIRDLKPIWLMSPLSVSDTLPLETESFDVVIFDEASQIPVEEAVPAIYRAPQVIVVGDEMQLPPTNFFSATSDQDEVLEAEENGERVAVLLDADSFLTQSAKNLPATLLAWHYRSRSESLIGFSNAAFYAGNLFTIPDRSIPVPAQGEILIRSSEDSAAAADALLERPISFHYLQSSPYENRRNAGEAAHIARLVRELLAKETGRSIGIVAFSEAQQGEIESALESLASEDTVFAARLEEEYVREEDDQFCGLFIKNLENVQGDERDIILLSICYGPGPDGRMVMNFGPINQRGGEKRLNVIFSRARHHMAIVSSIRHHAITNDYNDGAAALKNFLNYAECSSRGDRAMSRQILENLNPLARKQLSLSSRSDAVTEQLATALEQRGWEVDRQVGQSRFRCDLAIRAEPGTAYAVGILVDTALRYENTSVTERYVSQPAILEAFGWTVVQIFSRDWYHEPEQVLSRIERVIRGEREPELVGEEWHEIVPVNTGDSQPSERSAGGAAIGEPVIRAHCRLELIEGNSAKFWEATQEDCAVIICFGRIATKGQTIRKTFGTPGRATQEMEKLKAEKIRKGYVEK